MKTGEMEIGPKRYLYWARIYGENLEYYSELSEWCLRKYGVGGPWFFSNDKVCFYNERDRLIFLLRWA